MKEGPNMKYTTPEIELVSFAAEDLLMGTHENNLPGDNLSGFFAGV